MGLKVRWRRAAAFGSYHAFQPEGPPRRWVALCGFRVLRPRGAGSWPADGPMPPRGVEMCARCAALEQEQRTDAR